MSDRDAFKLGERPEDDPFSNPGEPQGAAGFERDTGFGSTPSVFETLLETGDLPPDFVRNIHPYEGLLALLQSVVELGISDVHFVEGEELPVFRVARSCVRMPSMRTLLPDLRNSFESFVVAGLCSLLPELASVDLFSRQERRAFQVGDRILRASFYKSGGLRALALRVMPRFPRPLDSLGFTSPLVSALCDTSPGLVLISGGTSCGKSSTLASLVDYYGSHSDFHIRILEDAEEYLFHTEGPALITRQTIGSDVPDYKSGVEGCLVHDVNVLVFGELRDVDSIRNAIFASTLNMLVLATIHAPDVSGTISRILDAYRVSDREEILRQLSSSLKVVVAQKMRRRRDEEKHLSELLYESCSFLSDKVVSPNRNIAEPRTHLVLDKYMRLSKVISETPTWSAYGCASFKS